MGDAGVLQGCLGGWLDFLKLTKALVKEGEGERDFSRGVYCCVRCTKVLKYDHYRVRQGS